MRYLELCRIILASVVTVFASSMSSYCQDANSMDRGRFLDSAIVVRNKMEKTALEGIEGVHVMVQALSHEESECGLSQSRLKTQVELHLRRNRVAILDTMPSSFTRYALLYISPNVDCLGALDELSGANLCASEIRLELKQVVYSPSRLKARLGSQDWTDSDWRERFCDSMMALEGKDYNVVGVIWNRGAPLLLEQGQVKEVIQKTLEDYLDDFCNAWLASRE